MKMMIVAFLFAPVVLFAQIMPEPATEALTPEDVLVTCKLENPSLDFTEINISKDGTMIATVNPLYTSSGEFAPFLVYPGMSVVETEKSVQVKGAIVTRGGLSDIDFTLTRGKENNIAWMGQPLSCIVK